MKQEYAYWMALAHLPKLSNKIKNELIVKIFQEGLSIIDLFQLDRITLKKDYLLNDNEITLLEESKNDLANYAFIVEDLLEQGYDIIPITSENYSSILKNNLKRSYSPPVIYTKGNKQILKEKSIAIVGSRDASEIALKFTDNVAMKASKDFKVVVSGFAKGVDKQALDSAIKYNGQSIIVLPQGIMTFDSGFIKYYRHIIDGNVIVLSTFFPKAPWNVKLAMARNPIIYGLAEEIYVAESSEKGGTWSGVLDGLRKGRKIFVRESNHAEKNANKILIEKGALPVDLAGNIVKHVRYEQIETFTHVVSEPKMEPIETKIYELLNEGAFTSKEIVKKLNLDWSVRKLTSFLKSHTKVQTINKKPLKFTIKQFEEFSLFN
ncbi:MAG: DNA transporter [Stygiobacter sp. RIFOXYA12_FULL_38_9]|nr:MAG: DNA transporter [Stygiobacter sp. GWC2_38_9]OGU85287.1 MAG: DNA transporter [Stygiobacter sp. RIFOXYA12_FULL_38_9]OGV05896.1 MAG: DNA transporter [Stygiobacter sp. RIFOXYB2_FULL_37_11]OGV10691.1 MAG: DNA transporter [Stygiobacter sp. RIFOXYA2_FULL_38_8]OGV14487.1 MAG: DNA transporter [Stygiobacter sp. RIFOXYC2_FULL_38_25]OGV82247.1 MAG: DNA transporter [Stygiobacter sp. GWF2_38_21]